MKIVIKGKIMKVTKIEAVGKQKVFDISVEDVEHYALSNGVVTHNTGVYLSADTIFIIGRQQDKDGTELIGYNFVLNVEKSRYSREKTKVFINVTHSGGINKWSGLLDMALESGHVIKPKNARFSKVNMDTGEVEEKQYKQEDTNNSAFWNSILNSDSFKEWVGGRYKVASGTMLTDEAIDTEIAGVPA
jgi:hypothetical protein